MKVFSIRTLCFVLLALLSLTPSAIRAQMTGQGAISGTVQDATGAIIPNATVTATANATGVVTTRKSTDTGYYVISPLLPGVYTVEVTATGFNKLVQQNVTVDALQTIGLNPKLAVGSVNETVLVTSAPPALQTANATLGAVMENATYSELPLQMTSGGPRDPTSFASLMPGAQSGGRSGIFDGTGSGNSNEMYVEGVPQTTVDSQGDNRKLNQNLSIEAVDQFQVQTSGTSAQYQGLGVENYSIKQGSNTFHGNANFFIRNTAFDSWGYFQPWTKVAKSDGTTGYPTKKAPEHQDELSLSLGGPVLHDKLFFFANYDKYTYNGTTNPTTQTIPTMDARNGDFSAYAAANPGYNIYDPTTEAACTTANAGVACAYQFHASKNGNDTLNIIPQSSISPLALAMAKNLPPVANTSLTNNYVSGRQTGLRVWGFTGRIDYTINPKQQIALISTSGVKKIPPYDYGSTSVLPYPYTNGTLVTETTTTDIIKHTYTFTPHAVNQFRYGLTRFSAPIQNATDGSSFSAANMGIGNLPAGLASSVFPGASFSGGVDTPTSFAAPNAYHEAVNTYTIGDEFLWIKGRHSVTIGGTFQFLQFNQSAADSPSKPMSFTYSNMSTAGFTAGTANTKSGLAYASYLIGAVDASSVYIQNFSTLGARYKAFSPYIQDDFKITKTLTLNLGLRWDLYTPFTEAQNRWSSFSPTLTNPATGTPGAIFYMGNGSNTCNCSTPVNTWYKNIGPRVGFAYQVDRRDVIRGAFSIMYTHSGGVGGSSAGAYNGTGQVGLTANTSFADSEQHEQPAFYLNSAIPNGNMSIPTYATTPNPTASANAGNYIANGVAVTASSVSYADPRLSGRPPYSESWNFGIQHQLTRDLTLSVDYTGNESHFLVAGLRGYYNNQLAPQYQALGTILAKSPSAFDTTKNMTYLQEAQAMMPGIALPYSTYGGSTATIGQMLKPFPQYNDSTGHSGVTDTWGDVGNSSYNALQLSLAQREWHGLTYTVNYTYSKTIDNISGSRSGYAIPGNVIDGGVGSTQANRIDRGVSANNIPNNLRIFGVYALPFGQPSQWGGSHFAVRALTGGWKLSFIFTKASGAPLTISGLSCQTPGSCYPSYNTSFSGPVRINGGYGKGITALTANSVPYIDANAFVSTPGNSGYNFGNVARTAPYNLYNIGNYDLDSGIKREFELHARLKFVFQADCLNVTNHTQFGGIGVSLASPSAFGRVTKQNNTARDWQFGGKFNF